jgi:hypothetical protein
VVPSIALELVLQKHAALPLDVAISNHQQSLEISDHEVVTAESSGLPSAVVDSQSDIIISSTILPTVVDAPVTIVVGSSASLVVALGLKSSDIVESSKAKQPDLATSEVGPMGAALVRSRQSARLVV